MPQKPKIFITRDDYPCNVYDMLKDTFELTSWKSSEILSKQDLIKNVKGKFGIICNPFTQIDKDVIDAAGNDLKVVSTLSVGYDHLDVKELRSRGVKIGFTPSILSEAVAEFAISLLLATSRRIVESHQIILKGGWTSTSWTPLWMCGHGLHESTIGIVGCGRIGLSIATKVKAFDPSRIICFNRSEKPEIKKLGIEQKSIDEVMKESDFLFVTLSQTDETKGIINKERISLMKSNAIIVNTGRGALIDQDALIEALQNKKIGGAGLDVFESEPLSSDSPLLKMNNVVVTPHIASATIECRNAMGKRVAENVLAVLNNEKMPSELPY